MLKHLVPLLFTSLMLVPSISHSTPPDRAKTLPIKCSTLQQELFYKLKEEHIPVSIFLVNGLKLQGRILNYDCNVIQLQATNDQIVFVHAISYIVATSNPVP